MEPIHVPAPSKTSFNKHRRVSDLLYSQLKHFQHVAEKQGIAIDPALPREIHTEGGAARYITAVTRAIREQGLAMQKGTNVPSMQLVTKPIRKTPAKPAADQKLAIAAAADSKTKAPAKKKITQSKAKKATKNASKK